jgi:hypothetical protein
MLNAMRLTMLDDGLDVDGIDNPDVPSDSRYRAGRGPATRTY